ncbi:hypothetical protein B5P45_11975 [Phyllobacterium zundukense]|uniref:Uncharacterized protein n=1 Tax=Phyllobacterium zundukense TaxID=1867719 RepID=A0A2N9VYL3_9HYPH|nr:hypothetical protein BLM14_25835 [Phyllobacterium zundukense]PIO44581.1 hypothetical protein B5P45_11975 [Phyllobacterium zundukense]
MPGALTKQAEDGLAELKTGSADAQAGEGCGWFGEPVKPASRTAVPKADAQMWLSLRNFKRV